MSQPPADALDGRPAVPTNGRNGGGTELPDRAEPPGRAGMVERAGPPSPNSRPGGLVGHEAPGAANGAADRRTELIQAAQEHWAAALTDLGGRNTLLYFKDRRSGTLDLAQADPEALQHLLTTGSIRLTKLFRDVDIRADAIRRIQVIYRKARELLEERGIRAGYLAVGMARWDELFLQPAAPVLLRGLTITPTRARHDDFDLLLDDEPEVNPVLLHKLATVYGAATDKLADLRGDRLYRALTAAA